MSIVRARTPRLADVIDALTVEFDGRRTIEFAGRTMHVCRRWFATLSDEEKASSLAGVAFRIVSPLIRPQGDKDPMLWNLACSAVTNANLVAAGYVMPAGVLLIAELKDRTSDEVYERIRPMEGKVVMPKLDA